MPDALPAAVYLLCFATSSACAYLLARNYRRTRMRLLLWSAICFVLLAGTNGMVIVDLLVFPDVDLVIWRLGFSLAAVLVLLFGFVWDLEE